MTSRSGRFLKPPYTNLDGRGATEVIKERISSAVNRPERYRRKAIHSQHSIAHCPISCCWKILLRPTAAQEDHDATRESGGSKSQRGACGLAVSLAGKVPAWKPGPEEAGN
jgi:hypothetical protein